MGREKALFGEVVEAYAATYGSYSARALREEPLELLAETAMRAWPGRGAGTVAG
ncbi:MULTISPECIES: hypothetical protein [unclassified Streptomyces]|uniref:hypothetical protein n=1 Tax=unclassified Streptomyces TaxID=2593676 RepID=UPI002E0DC35C|nr:hypothetical protein OG452_10300 [Streptomyces sp. NBC_01197]WSS51625.1 hypothetical protein OG708_25080 [Streptomyces sp. NBC_01180]